MNLIQQITTVVREIPRFIERGINRAVIRQHRPVDVGDGITPPVCLSHRKPLPWPCREVVEAVDRMHYPAR